jgi:hypothetical protein
MISCPCRRFNRCSFFGSPYICTDVHFLPRRINRRSNLYKAATVLGFPISSHNHAAATPAARTVPRPLLRALPRPPPPPRPRRRAAASPPCAAALLRVPRSRRHVLRAPPPAAAAPSSPRPRRRATAPSPTLHPRRAAPSSPRPRHAAPSSSPTPHPHHRAAASPPRHRPPRRRVLVAVHQRSICRLIPRSSQHHGSRQEKGEGTSG